MMKEWLLNLDRPRRLRFDFKAIRALRERYAGKDLPDLMNLAFDELPYFAWVGLVWEDPALTPAAVEMMLNENIGIELTIAGVAETIAGALAAHTGIEPGKKAMSSDDAQERSESQPENSKL
jgi:hypothetical protein